MKDLTEGPIPKHVASLAVPMTAGMLLQTLYFFVDLYFVSRLGEAAIAGVSAASTLNFVNFFLVQMLAVGTVAMISHAVGRKDRAEANHVFNQAVAIAALFTAITLAGGYAIADPYTRFFAPDDAAREAGATFLRWFLPSMALQFPIVLMASGLRGTGIVKPATAVQGITVILNVIFAPILIAGWGTGHPLGVAGAGLASTLAAAIGVFMLVAYFVRLEHYVGFDSRRWKPHAPTWRRLLGIGLPAGGEFALMALFMGIMLWAARGFGTEAQAGVGLGFRINQMMVVPALGIAFAAAPIAGQNFGAGHGERVRETFRVAVGYCAMVMAALTALIHWRADLVAGIFTSEAAVIGPTVLFLTYLSWNWVATGVIVTCSSLFQAMGNTWPAFGASALRILIFALPSVWMAGQPWFELRHIFMLSIATILVQMAVSLTWLRAEFAKRLPTACASPGSLPSRP
jgi:putative MATE family efflux protein